MKRCSQGFTVQIGYQTNFRKTLYKFRIWYAKIKDFEKIKHKGKNNLYKTFRFQRVDIRDQLLKAQNNSNNCFFRLIIFPKIFDNCLLQSIVLIINLIININNYEQKIQFCQNSQKIKEKTAKTYIIGQENPSYTRNESFQLNTHILKGYSINNFMKQSLRKERSIIYSRKHQLYPFEHQTQLQKFCQKTESSLFMFGSHSKKRPHNIVFGRTFQYKILDMVEFGIKSIKSIDQLAPNCQLPLQCRPFIIFQGDIWETDEEFKKIRNLFNDFFYENNKVQGIEINKMLQVVVCITALEDKRVYMQFYEVGMQGKNILQDDNAKLIVQQLGPNVELTLRRTSFADNQMWKKATYVPKPKKKKQNKNIAYDGVGNKKGKLFVDQQNLSMLPSKKRKLISKNRPNKPIKQKLNEQKNENEFAA